MIAVVVALILVGLSCIIVAGLALARGARYRIQAKHALYDVRRQEHRRHMLSAFFWVTVLLVLGVLFLAASGFIIRRDDLLETEPISTATSTVRPPTSLPATPSASPTVPPIVSTSGATPTTPPNIPTLTPIPPTHTPTLTSTPEPPTAVVNSPNGLYLRDVPGGTAIVELIPDGSELLLLEGEASEDGIIWRRVQTPVGNVGWVAQEYLLLPEQE